MLFIYISLKINKIKNDTESPGVEGEWGRLRQRSSKRSRTRSCRWSRRGPTKRTRGTHSKPFINAIGMEAVMAIGYAPYGILRQVVGQANGARAVIGIG